MLHNTGPFGPNEAPVNMGTAVTIPELNGPVNIAQNLSNLVKMSQQTSNPNSAHFNLQDYVGYAGSSLNNITPMHNTQGSLDLQTSLSINHTNLLQTTLRQNGMLPERFNFNAAQSHNPLEIPFFNNFHHLRHPSPEFLNAAYLSSMNINNSKDKESDTISTSLNFKDDMQQKANLNVKEFPLIKKEFDVNLKNDKSDCESSRDVDNELNLSRKSSKCATPEYIEISIQNSSLSKIDNDEQSGSKNVQVKKQPVVNNDSSESDPEDEMPLSLTRKIKKEPLDEEETAPEVVVKVEKVTSWTDLDHMQAFLKDGNGVLREDSSHGNIIGSDNSIAKATELIQNGSSTEYYFECPHCCLLFDHPKRFLVHSKWHSFGLLNEKRLEEAQDKIDRRRLKLTKKTENANEEEDGKEGEEAETFACVNCDKTFSNKTSLRNHRHKYHPNREHECKICHKVVMGWFGLKTHMATHNTDPGLGYQCDKCPKRFKHAHSLAKHRDTHLEKTHACTQCSKKYGSPSLLKMHMRTHERMQRGPTYACSYCAKSFYESYTLQVHERTHRNERPYQCQICNTSYGTNSSLKRHMKVSHTHSTTKPFECDTCHRCFVSELIRDRHAAREHGTPGQLQYACTKCTCRYLRLKDLQRHMNRIHPKGKKRRKDSESE